MVKIKLKQILRKNGNITPKKIDKSSQKYKAFLKKILKIKKRLQEPKEIDYQQLDKTRITM